MIFNFIIYADDTTLSSTLNTFNDNIQNDNLESLINYELFKINEWLKINKLSLNMQNLNMTFQRTNKNVQTLTLKIDKFNFLGVIIDTNLNWKRHTEKISNACSTKIGILNKLKRVITTN